MKIGIIGPSKLENEDEISKIAKIVAESGHEIVLTPDKGSSSEYFALEYIKNNGKKVYEVIPLDDKEFGINHVNLDLGVHINCNTWRNQPEKLNEETKAFICLGYASGGLIEIGYTKWFNPKPVYIIMDIDSDKLPKKINDKLDIHYISISDLEDKLK